MAGMSPFGRTPVSAIDCRVSLDAAVFVDPSVPVCPDVLVAGPPFPHRVS